MPFNANMVKGARTDRGAFEGTDKDAEVKVRKASKRDWAAEASKEFEAARKLESQAEQLEQRNQMSRAQELRDSARSRREQGRFYRSQAEK